MKEYAAFYGGVTQYSSHKQFAKIGKALDFMMRIETFERIPKSTSTMQKRPFLFIHGACLGAWCWTDWFLDYFAAAGHYSIALNLRGHGGSSGADSLQKWRVDDYVEDVASVARSLSQPPIIIGHSMGGLIAQRFAAQHPTSGVVLMAPSPYSGMRSQTIRLLRAHFWQFFKASLTKDITHIYQTNQTVKQILFSPTTPEEIVTHCRERLQKESWLAVQELNDPLKNPHPISSPMLVLGGELDGTVQPAAIRGTAKAYGAPCHIFKGMGHNLMLEPSWQKVATHIENWFNQEVGV